jgi:hypothetical protein
MEERLNAKTEANIRRYLYGDACTKPTFNTETITVDSIIKAAAALKSLQPQRGHVFVITDKDAGAVIQVTDVVEVVLSNRDRVVFTELKVGAVSKCGRHTIKSYFFEKADYALPPILPY